MSYYHAFREVKTVRLGDVAWQTGHGRQRHVWSVVSNDVPLQNSAAGFRRDA